MPINLGTAEGHIDLDFSNLKTEVASAVKELEKLDKEGDYVQSQYKLLETTFNGVSGTLQQAALKSQKLTAEIETSRKKVESYKKNIDILNTVITKSKDEQEKLAQKIEETRKKCDSAEEKVKSMAEAHGKASEEYKNATQKAQEYRNELLQQETRYVSLGDEIDSSRQKITEYRTAVNNTSADIQAMTQELMEAENKIANYGVSVEKAGDKIKSAGQKMNDVGNILTLGVSTPLVGIGVAAVNAGNDFEAQMSRVKAIAGATGDEFEKLEQQAIDLGASTAFSATECAEAMENLASAGFTTREIMEAVPGMLDLAASSGEDLASSADIAASTLRGFGLEASEAGHVADVLAKNAADTNAAIADTGLAMKYIAPVAYSAGWSLEEVTTAIGKMADAGIKGEQAGTTLRGGLTRLMKPTKEMTKAMERVGIEFYDASGKMKPLSTIIDDLQKGTSKMTDEQRDSAIAAIFGTEALSGWKVLLQSSKKELDKMTKGLENSDGAAKEMAETMLDNTKGSIEEMNGSLETAGITLQKAMAPSITKVAKTVTDLANKFSELDPEIQENVVKFGALAAAAGPVLKIGGNITKGVGTLTKGLGKLTTGFGKLIKGMGKKKTYSVVADGMEGIAGAAANATTGVKGTSGVLSKLGGPFGIAAIAATAIAGIGIALETARKKAVEANLEEHFGDIKLSAEEVEDVAKRLTTNEWTMKIDAVIEARDKLEEFQEEINTAVEEMDKIGWKVGIGLDLTESEKKAFQDSAEQYINSATELLEQKQYTVTLAINTLMTPGTKAYESISKFTTEFYGDTRSELERLGEEYAKAVNEAFADGVLTEDENLNLQTIQQKIQDMVDRAADAEYQGKLSMLELQAPKSGLTADSFKDLQEQIGEALNERMSDAQEAYSIALGNIELALKEDAIDPIQYLELKSELTKGFNQDKSEIVLDGLNIQIGTIQTNYQEDIDKFTTEFSKTMGDSFDRLFEGEEYGRNVWKNIWSGLENAANNTYSDADPDSINAIHGILEKMQPTTDELEKLAQAYKDAGMVPPKSVTQGLLDVYQLEAMTKNSDHIFELLADEIANSPDAKKAISYAIKSGSEIPEELAKALKENYGIVVDATTGVFSQIQKPALSKTEEIKQVMSEAGLDISDSLAEAIASKGTSVQSSTLKLLDKIGEGKTLKEEEIKTLLSNLGIQSADALATSLKSKKPELQEETIQLLAQISGGVTLKESEICTLFENLGINASDEVITSFQEKKPDVQAKAIELLDQLVHAEASKRPEILGQLFELGVAVDDSLGKGITNNLEFVRSKTEGMIDVIDTKSEDKIAEITPDFAKYLKKMGTKGLDDLSKLMEDTDISSPGVKPLSKAEANKWGNSATSILQGAIGAVQVGISAISGISKHAEGGIFYKPHIAAFAEDGPEAVIPLSENRRASALDIWQEAGEMLGAQEEVYRVLAPKKKKTTSTSFDYDTLARKLAAELRKTPIQVKPEVHVRSGDVYLDKDRVGYSLAPIMDARLETLQRRRERGG